MAASAAASFTIAGFYPMIGLRMAHALETPLAPLLRDFRELEARGDAFVLATIVSTEGSTYRKPGTQMLIATGLEPRGLLSGGCLEADLVAHARDVAQAGAARSVRYDMRGEHDRVYGIGSGCEGAMRVLLQRVGPAECWQPLAAMAARVEARAGGALALVVVGAAAGRAWWPAGGDAPWPEPDAVRAARESILPSETPRRVAFSAGGEVAEALVIPLRPPPLLLVCGAGADARPLAQLAVALGFEVTVCDHRPALLDPPRFPHCRLRCQPAAEFARVPELAACDAAIVMGHHFEADLAYLEALAGCDAIGYVGLLGPAPRRDRLLASLGPRAALLEARLRAPVGLDIGARTPEAIALAAAGELHAWLAGRGGGPWHERIGRALA
jgi:xanthine/CO dehydrogenase XdhC/CoxF family maturation factor